MKCLRKKPEACFNCTLPDCVDTGSPERDETAYLHEFLPDHKTHRTDKRRKVLQIMTDEWMDRIERRHEGRTDRC